jgi:Glycosyltransferase
MVRVLHVIDSLDLGGAQTALLNLLKYADRSQFHHEVAAMHGEGMFAAAFRDLGVPVHSLSAHRFPPGYLVNLPRLLRGGSFDIAQFHLFGANWIAKPLAALCGVRCRYHHDQCNDAFRSESRIATAIDTLTNRLSTRILAVSRSVEQFNLRVEGWPSERVTFLPNSVDTEEFRPASEAERAEARRRFELPPDAFVIGGVGRHTPQKNFGLLLDAAPSDAVLVLFGSGPEEAMLRERAGANVRFTGTVNDRAAIYRAIDILALPSRFEGLPMTVLEAMASGVPVAASSVDGVREIATDGETALLFESGDAAGLRGALEQLQADAELRTRLAEAGRVLVTERFCARLLAAELERIYRHDLDRLAAK